MTLSAPLTWRAWARTAAGWRPCVHYTAPDLATDVHEARYLAARWLAIDGTREAVVVPDGVEPNRYMKDFIPGVVWRGVVTLDRTTAL